MRGKRRRRRREGWSEEEEKKEEGGRGEVMRKRRRRREEGVGNGPRALLDQASYRSCRDTRVRQMIVKVALGPRSASNTYTKLAHFIRSG